MKYLLLSGLALSACTSPSMTTQTPINNSAVTTPSSAHRLTLDGEWQIIRLNGESIKSKKKDYSLFFTVAERRIAAYFGCNRIFGLYQGSTTNTLGESQPFSVNHLASTRMLCQDDADERAGSQALQMAASYEIQSIKSPQNHLILRNKNGDTLIEAIAK